jgi:formylglycine-generating enzyme required for sulfatase activity
MTDKPLPRYLLFLPLISLICLIFACTKTEKHTDSGQGQGSVEFYYHESEYKYEPSNFTIDEKNFYKETTLTNSIKVDREHFSIEQVPALYMTLEYFPNYKNDTGPWVIYNSSGSFDEEFGLSVHIPNLPNIYEVHIYDNDSNLFRKFTADKHEVTYKDYTEVLSEQHNGEILAEVRKVLPFYTFHFPRWVSHTKQLFKTEICSTNNDVLFSTFIEYPIEPFVVEAPNDGRLLRYSGDSPVYIVLYKEVGDFENVFPIDAFLITPENGYWEGTLHIATGTPYGELILIFLFKLDPDKPDDYSKRVDNTWIYFIKN